MINQGRPRGAKTIQVAVKRVKVVLWRVDSSGGQSQLELSNFISEGPVFCVLAPQLGTVVLFLRVVLLSVNFYHIQLAEHLRPQEERKVRIIVVEITK